MQLQQIITRFCGWLYTVGCGEPSDHVNMLVLFFQNFMPPQLNGVLYLFNSFTS